MRDPDSTVEDKIRRAFETAKPGDVLKICRWNCKTDHLCPMCATVHVFYGMTVEDVLQIAKAHRA